MTVGQFTDVTIALNGINELAVFVGGITTNFCKNQLNWEGTACTDYQRHQVNGRKPTAVKVTVIVNVCRYI
jgi:hypothetical protein